MATEVVNQRRSSVRFASSMPTPSPGKKSALALRPLVLRRLGIVVLPRLGPVAPSIDRKDLVFSAMPLTRVRRGLREIAGRTATIRAAPALIRAATAKPAGNESRFSLNQAFPARFYFVLSRVCDGLDR